MIWVQHVFPALINTNINCFCPPICVSGWMTPQWEASRRMWVTRPLCVCFTPNPPPIIRVSTMTRTPCWSWFLSSSRTSAGSKKSYMTRRGSVRPTCFFLNLCQISPRFPSNHEALFSLCAWFRFERVSGSRLLRFGSARPVRSGSWTHISFA